MINIANMSISQYDIGYNIEYVIENCISNYKLLFLNKKEN